MSSRSGESLHLIFSDSVSHSVDLQLIDDSAVKNIVFPEDHGLILSSHSGSQLSVILVPVHLIQALDGLNRH